MDKDVMNKEVTDPDAEVTFDYLNTDVHLLTLNILLEGFYRGQGTFTLDQFLKGNYWKIEEIADEIKDTNDFGSVEDMVLHQVIAIIESFNLAKIRRLCPSILNKTQLKFNLPVKELPRLCAGRGETVPR